MNNNNNCELLVSFVNNAALLSYCSITEDGQIDRHGCPSRDLCYVHTYFSKHEGVVVSGFLSHERGPASSSEGEGTVCVTGKRV